uniref:UDP-glucose:2-hydroxyflavanone C-glucosyltransferase-like n=1 Tax=Elaeis guineensis var. tenera TaxID=51953 RepID=A0A6I9RKV6_ELAGV|nr:UDP-glucose:2-hydroxyflavanone C-glucosyltransferase-like [Elaeis guineensis]
MMEASERMPLWVLNSSYDHELQEMDGKCPSIYSGPRETEKKLITGPCLPPWTAPALLAWFLWVVKTKKVDREDGEVELEGLLGEGYLERVKDRGLVVKGWVDQEEILRHRAIGGFLSHCGSNSVFEAAFHGVPVLGWPGGGDQRVNAEVVVRRGLGIWVKEWSWEGEEEVVMGEEIGERVRQLMEDEGLQASAARLREEAVKAVAEDGSSGKGLAEFIRML